MLLMGVSARGHMTGGMQPGDKYLGGGGTDLLLYLTSA